MACFPVAHGDFRTNMTRFFEMKSRISKFHVAMIVLEILALGICMVIVTMVVMGE